MIQDLQASLSRHRLPPLTALALAALLAACGGGGDASSASAGEDSTDTTSADSDTANADTASAAHAAAQEANAVAAAAGTGATLTDEVEAVSSSQRATAQATTYATPKVAALEFSWNVSAAQQAVLAKYGLVIIDKGRLRGPTAYNSFANGISSINSSTKVAQYVVNQELKCAATGDGQWEALVSAANSANFWLRYANGSKAQWSTSYGACDMNMTTWGARNAAGQTWMQVKWASDRAAYYGTAPSLDYAMIDNFFYQGRTTSNWKRDGVNRAPGTSDIAASYRAGQVAYVTALRSANPTLKVMGNTSDNDLSTSQYKGLLDGAWMEALMGKSWSIETLKGWSGAMARYRATMANTRSPHDVAFEAIGGAYDYQKMRYGLGSALMDNGYYMYRTLNWSETPRWYDEYSAQIGTATQSPPTAATQNGVWSRTFQNGIVLLNPQSFSATITIPALYKRITGTQAPGVNNGAYQTSITLGAKDALIMIRR